MAYKVLFVCSGNICRSPTAEAVFRHMAEAAGLGKGVEAKSAGTHGYHTGDPPDPRTIAAAAKRGFDVSSLRARKIQTKDFHDFDLILAMDREHLEHLTALKPKTARAEVKLFLEYHSTGAGQEVPDPYYGGPAGFERVLDLVEAGCRGLLKSLPR